jgi:general stress protein YciG
MNDKSIKEMSVREAGRRGGLSTAKKHGQEFFKEIGRKGGLKNLETKGREHFVKAGIKSGQLKQAKIAQASSDINSY